ncbi:MAG TPA: ECF transporter S component [Jiangellales bacterium]|nr:ECF transporter S component [Jiangellales bacterium]
MSGDAAARAGGRVAAVRVRPRSALVLALVSSVGVVAFGWPFLADPGSGLAHSGDAPWVFVVLLPLLLLVVVAELSDGGMDAKAVAVLGVLAAVGAGLRVLGTGTAGIEPIFVLLILAGRVMGPGFGFVLGNVALLASAFVTGGVGPWLPFQMIGAGWVGLGAGLLPAVRGRAELGLLAAYGAVTGFAYGALLNLWFWPFATYLGGGIGFVGGDPVGANLVRYGAFYLATSVAWDLMRAVFTAVLVLVTGRAVLAALRRTARRASFGVVPGFEPAAR